MLGIWHNMVQHYIICWGGATSANCNTATDEYKTTQEIQSYSPSADDYSTEYYRALAIVESNGLVFWAPPTKFRSTCPVGNSIFLVLYLQTTNFLMQ